MPGQESRLAGGPADVARSAVVPWLCVTAFRRVCSEQRYVRSMKARDVPSLQRHPSEVNCPGIERNRGGFLMVSGDSFENRAASGCVTEGESRDSLRRPECKKTRAPARAGARSRSGGRGARLDSAQTLRRRRTRPAPPMPTRPRARRPMVAGSGTEVPVSGTSHSLGGPSFAP